MARKTTGKSAGLTLRYVGGDGMFGGSCLAACAMAACTSCAAASMSRSNVNCTVIFTEPSELTDDIVSTPAMVESCFSSGVATAEAIVSGLAPGRLAEMLMVG